MAIANFWLAHGWAEWAAWGILTIAMIWSNRHCKNLLHGKYIYIHIAAGYLILLATLIWSMWAWYKENWRIKNNYHSYFAFPVLFTIIFLTIGGTLTRKAMQDF